MASEEEKEEEVKNVHTLAHANSADVSKRKSVCLRLLKRDDLKLMVLQAEILWFRQDEMHIIMCECCVFKGKKLLCIQRVPPYICTCYAIHGHRRKHEQRAVLKKGVFFFNFVRSIVYVCL